MNYAKINGSQLVKYPYSWGDLRSENPYTAFTSTDLIDAYQGTDDNLSGNSLSLVKILDAPSFDAEKENCIIKSMPEQVNGEWILTWDVIQKSQDEIDTGIEQWRKQATCTPFQGRMALADASLLSNVEAAVAAADEKTKVAWEYALEWKRMSPMIATLGAALNLTDAEIDDLFKAASQIVA